MNSEQYIVFTLNDEDYGIRISCAREIIRIPDEVIQLPNMPAYVEGVFNLRGKVIPIINLHKKFNLEAIYNNRLDTSRLLIIEFDDIVMGIIVDDVSDIINIQENSIERMSSSFSYLGIDSISGIGKIDERLILLLDVTRLKNDIFTYTNEMEAIV